MYGSGAGTGMVAIPRLHKLIPKVQVLDPFVSYVAARVSTARSFVALPTEKSGHPAITDLASVSASPGRLFLELNNKHLVNLVLRRYIFYHVVNQFNVLSQHILLQRRTTYRRA